MSTYAEFVDYLTGTQSPDGWDFDPATETVQYDERGRYCEIMFHNNGRNTIIAHGPKEEHWTEIEDSLTDPVEMIRWCRDQMSSC